MIVRLLMPFMMTEVMKKAQRNMESQFKRQQQYQQRYQQVQNEGDINVDFTPPKTKKKFSFKKDEGEFVDFEEIKK